MKVLISLLCLMATSYAEPPVGEGYPAARSGHSHHGSHAHHAPHNHHGQRGHNDHHGHNNHQHGYEHSDVQRDAPSSTYLPSITAARSFGAPSQEYGVPSSKTGSSNQDYSTPSTRSSEISAAYGVPSALSGLNQEYSVPAARNSISQEYGVPSARSGSISQEYGVPSARSGISQEYGVPAGRTSEISQEYGVPSAKTGSLSQEYSVPSSRTASLSEEYGVPSVRSELSQDYGVPDDSIEITDDFGARNAPSDTYGAPESRAGLSTQYGPPEFRTPTEEYGVPAVRNQGSKHGSSQGRSALHHSGSSSFRSTQGNANTRNNELSSTYGPPAKSSFRSAVTSSRSFGTSRPSSSSYLATASRSSAGYSPSAKSSDSYVAAFRSSNVAAPIAKTLSALPKSIGQDYSAPSRSDKQKTTAIASSYTAASARSSSPPSQKYLPSSTKSADGTYNYNAPELERNVDMPSEQYGVPDQYNEISGQGYSYARNALDELLNQEPANYDFAYKVSDIESGSDFGHTESRQENRAEGSYFVVLPDGTKQVVEYEADERGFKPRISVEPAQASGRTGGYDDNAAEIIDRSAEGPY